MVKAYPQPGAAMMEARKHAFSEASRPHPFRREEFETHSIQIERQDCHDSRRSALVERIVKQVSTFPDGSGIGYCLLEGVSELMTLEDARELSHLLFRDVWQQFRLRSCRISADRDFHCTETLTKDGEIPEELFGSRWSFKPAHADRNGVLFSHVYGPTAGFDGGEAFVIDALAYATETGLGFDELFVWSDEPREQKPVLRPEHVDVALASHGRRFGKLTHDAILFVNNSPEGLLHGATEFERIDERAFSRSLHRCVVREREPQDTEAY